MDKKIICIPVSIHWVKADIMYALRTGLIDFKKDSLRSIAKKIGVRNDCAQIVKHHLEGLVNLGSIDKKHGMYFFETKQYTFKLNKHKKPTQ